MNSLDLSFFLAAAQASSIGGAAKALNTVQSNVTGRIRRLEDDLGAVLFHRHARGVALTEAGERLLPFAIEMDRLLEEGRQAVVSHGRPQGALLVGAMETTTALRLGDVIAQFSSACPEVHLTLRTGTTAALLDLVLRGDIEAALVCGPVVHPDLAATHVFSEELVLLTGPSHGGLDSLSNTRRVRIFVLSQGFSYRQHLETLLLRRGIAAVEVAEYGTVDAILSCVAAGMGVTLLPEALVALYAHRYRLCADRLAPREALVDTVLVRRRRAPVSSAMRSFAALLPEVAVPVAAE
jgi:DNA-binding transcriptional LysR family regulator